MNKIIKDILVFAAGVAVGSITASQVFKGYYKKYYSEIADEEIASVKEKYSGKKIDISERTSEEKKAELETYENLANEYNSDKEGDAATMEDDEPYVISPDEFGELTYETVTLTYYADKVLADEVEDIVEDVAGTIGLNSLLHFGEYEDDCVHVRNDRLEIDYEILLDSRSYWGDIKRDGRPAEN